MTALGLLLVGGALFGAGVWFARRLDRHETARGHHGQYAPKRTPPPPPRPEPGYIEAWTGPKGKRRR